MDDSLTNQHKCQMMFKLLMIYHSQILAFRTTAY